MGSLITRQGSSHQNKSENQINKELSNLPKRLLMEQEMDQRFWKISFTAQKDVEEEKIKSEYKIDKKLPNLSKRLSMEKKMD